MIILIIIIIVIQPLPGLARLAGVPAHAVELPSPEGAGELAAVGPGEGTCFNIYIYIYIHIHTYIEREIDR